MKFYLIDDDKNVLHILKRIIRDRGLGEIAGTAENGRRIAPITGRTGSAGFHEPTC